MGRYRPRDAATTSRIMSSVRSTGNRAEVALRRRLWALGCRYRLYNRGLPGRPDLTFPGPKVIVFVDGDFWHGRVLQAGGEQALAALFPPEKRGYWVPKIRRNVERDRNNDAHLRSAGWCVIRIWESDLLRAPAAHANRIARIVQRRDC